MVQHPPISHCSTIAPGRPTPLRGQGGRAMLRSAQRSLAVIALLFAAAGVVVAQTATSTLSGVVRDAAGGLVAGAAVTARDNATGLTRRTATDSGGRYSLPNLPPGDYELRIEMQGFKGTVRTVTLTVGGNAVQDVALEVGQRAEEITVSTAEPAVERTKTDLSRVVGERE